ncbi:hypothetical protein [Streptomyces sp. NPDC097981]|uniref:hypothetical protein n=1 Tax=Streptomyces sp. NPDC097981 TaxID=3155428 RepID=UPI00332E9724
MHRPALAEAAVHGDAVLLALAADAACAVVGQPAPCSPGGSCSTARTVPMRPGDGGPEPSGHGALRLAAAAPGAHLAKVSGLVHESIRTLDEPVFEGAPLAVPFAADAPEAVRLTTELITGMGCTPLPCGGLSRAPLLEVATALFAIGVW